MEHGCKVLHLTPQFIDTSEEKSYIVLEDDDCGEIRLNPQQLKELLEPAMGTINIDLVLIEMTNCEEFCKVFLDLGVPHVISFRLIEKHDDCCHDESDNE